MEKSNVEKQKLQLTTQMEKQQDIAQTCIVRSCNEIELGNNHCVLKNSVHIYNTRGIDTKSNHA